MHVHFGHILQLTTHEIWPQPLESYSGAQGNILERDISPPHLTYRHKANLT